LRANPAKPENNLTMIKRSFLIVATAVALALVNGCSTPSGQTESTVVARLASPNPDTVRGAMATLESSYPHSTTWHPAVRKMLADPREEVVLKAARVLGVVHAEVADEDLKNITALFRSARPNVTMGALKALRGLKAGSIVPQILPLLQSDTPGIIRDALRTLAVVGNPSLVSQIEPLLNHANVGVRKDALDCLTALKAKS
jgi:HEAT repeat protein